MRKIKTSAELSALYGERSPASLAKVAPHLTPLYAQWIRAARFCILSTVGAQGVHGSPRGDDGPVVRVDGPGRLLMPDWRGNNRLDCLQDIVSDGRIAMLFLVPGVKTTVRVNGTAWLTDDETLRTSFARKTILPASVIVLDIAEVYTQCTKALIRSGLWTRDDAGTVPTSGQILEEVTNGAITRPAFDAAYGETAQPRRLW
ncbi:MAG: MSMEG_1061 family FMN-dependent PPOX-type flavoprotein [Paracoccaceae bacterium]